MTVSPYLSKPLRSEQEVRKMAHDTLSEQLIGSIVQIAKAEARPHVIDGIVGRIIQLRNEIREHYEHCESDFYAGLMADWLEKLEAIQNQVEDVR